MKEYLPLAFVNSILGALILYILREEPIQALFFSMLVAIVNFLYVIRLDMLKNHRQVLDSIDAKSTEILHAIGVRKEVYEDESMRSILQDIISNYCNIKAKSQRPIYFKQLIKTLQSCSAVISDLAKGKLVFEKEEERISVLIPAMREAERTLKAVSHIHINWWFSGLGNKYLEENRLAVERGLKVERIFVLGDRKSKEEPQDFKDYLDLIKKQLDFGVIVYVARASDVSKEIRRNFLILDDQFVTKPDFNREGTNQGGMISSDPSVVSGAIDDWECIRVVSQPIEDSKSLDEMVQQITVSQDQR